jgi:hypothetical protein
MSIKQENLIQNARALCMQLQTMQDLLLEMYSDEMLELDEKEELQRSEGQQDFPF